MFNSTALVIFIVVFGVALLTGIAYHFDASIELLDHDRLRDAAAARKVAAARAAEVAWRTHNASCRYWVTQLKDDSPAVKRVAQLMLDYLRDQRNLLPKCNTLLPTYLPSVDTKELLDARR